MRASAPRAFVKTGSGVSIVSIMRQQGNLVANVKPILPPGWVDARTAIYQITPARMTTATGANLFDRVNVSFMRQGMMQHLGARLVRVAPGECELALPYSDRVTQQQGGFHGGAMGALADIAGGYAGLTAAPEGMEVVSVEYKVNFLAAFKGGELRATGKVLKAGRRIIVTTAEVVHVHDGKASLCATMQQTLVPVTKTY